jgi:chromosome segregation ATPase
MGVMVRVTSDIITTIILSVFSTGVIAAFINWLKERKKDEAATKLTDIQTLQGKLAYIEGVAEYLRKHNDSLQKDYDELEDRNRRMRVRISELEEELDKVKRSAAQTQAECERLSNTLQELIGEVNK